jgi:hypothetical protein
MSTIDKSNETNNFDNEVGTTENGAFGLQQDGLKLAEQSNFRLQAYA